MREFKYGETIGTVKICGKPIEVISNGNSGYRSGVWEHDAEDYPLGIRGQCVHFVRSALSAITGVNPAQLHFDNGDARDWARNAHLMNLYPVETHDVRAGDVGVFDGGKFGHVVVANSDSGRQIRVSHQNCFNDERDLDTPLNPDGTIHTDTGEIFRLMAFFRMRTESGFS